MTDPVNHPDHYGGGDNPYEAIKVIEAWDLGFSLGSAVKYISRHGRKAGESAIQDLRKAAWYINREADRLENAQGAALHGSPGHGGDDEVSRHTRTSWRYRLRGVGTDRARERSLRSL